MARSPTAIDRDWVRQSLSGPITAIHPPFLRDGSLDYDGLRTEIEHNIAAGSGVLLLTYGDSLHSLITDAEVAELMEAVVDQARRRVMVVAADRQWWTGKEIEFADFAHEAGADILMVLPPAWAASVTHDSLVTHYRAVSEHIPVMPVTNLFIPNQAMGLRVLRTLVEQVPNIVAIKEDVLGEFARRTGSIAHERWAVLSGSLKQDHLNIHPYGCDGYMSIYMHFMPEIAHAYWRAVQANDLRAATAIIEAYDQTWIDLAESLDGRDDALMHASQEVFGIAGRWRRPPYHSLTDAEMDRVRAFYAGLPRIEDVAPAHAGP